MTRMRGSLHGAVLFLLLLAGAAPWALAQIPGQPTFQGVTGDERDAEEDEEDEATAAATPGAPGAPGSGRKRRVMPWQQKDELGSFEPALTPWPPLPPGMSFEDLMDEFLHSKNMTQESRVGPVPTPDWDRQHLINRELFNMKRDVVVPKLLALIEKRHPDLLQVAVELSAYFEDKRVIPEVMEVAGDRSLPPKTRITAAVTLGRVGDAAITPALIELYKKEPDPLVRAVLIEQMDFAGVLGAIPFLCEQVRRDEDVNVRVSAVFGLVNFDTDESIDCIIAATKSRDDMVREMSARVLGRSAGVAAAAAMKNRPFYYHQPGRMEKIARARTAVNPMLQDSVEKVRIAAARTLFDVGDASSIPFIEKALEGGSIELKEILVELLGRIREHIDDPQPPDDFLPIPTEKVIPALVKQLESGEERVAYQAARSLGYTKSELAVAPLERALLESPSQVVRTNAAQALGYIKSDSAVLALIAAIPKADQRVQYAIAQSLSMSKKPAAVTALMGMARQGEVNFRANALSLLGEAGDPQAIPILRGALSDTNPTIQASAIRGLGYLKDRRAIPELISQLDATTPQIRAAAVNALVEFKDPKLTALVAAKLRDPEEAVRSTTLDALERNGDPRAAQYIVDRYNHVRDDLQFAELVGSGNVQAFARDAGNPVPSNVDWDVVPFMTENITAPNWQKRLACMFALGRIGDAERSVPILRELMKDNVVDVRVSALDTLGNLGANDPETIKAIKELIARGDDRWVRDIGVSTLVKLGDKETIDWVKDQAANHENPEMRHYAIMYIQESGNKELLPFLMERLDDKDEIGLAITSIGLVPGGPPYYEASSGMYPKVQDAVMGAIRKLAFGKHPAIDIEPDPEAPGYGIFETPRERERAIEELKTLWPTEKDKWMKPSTSGPGEGTATPPEIPITGPGKDGSSTTDQPPQP